MNKEIRKQVKALEKLNFNELQARFAEIVGEETRAPNRKFLIRRITEALEAKAEETPAEAKAKPAKKRRTAKAKPTEKPAQETEDQEEQGTPLRDLSVQELQTMYEEKVGRPTGSAKKSYLKWKIRQAEKGRIRVGPVQRRHGDGPPPDFKVLPLRMEADLVVQLDEARERLGLGSRMDLFRRSLHAYLQEAGETDVAELFAPEA
ncbi:MAG: hypothetical protein CSA24_00010 [Deltaproteobacteria bacterium]|nr:MAG: hypothetical protein CSB49_05470 [Pseudomonadota bacterium]PIE66472.1 MAG: hypothetical protein CSA24_00010 [Deltaproteobacteria bacterium]